MEKEQQGIIIAKREYAHNAAQYHNLGAEVAQCVSIEIVGRNFENLLRNKYKLCIAKKVKEGDYNVVWQSFDDYNTPRILSWVPTHTIFATI